MINLWTTICCEQVNAKMAIWLKMGLLWFLLILMQNIPVKYCWLHLGWPRWSCCLWLSVGLAEAPAHCIGPRRPLAPLFHHWYNWWQPKLPLSGSCSLPKQKKKSDVLGQIKAQKYTRDTKDILDKPSWINKPWNYYTFISQKIIVLVHKLNCIICREKFGKSKW